MSQVPLEGIKQNIVIVRVNFDVPSLESLDPIHNLGRIGDALPTICQLLQNGNKVVLLSHWGRPEKPEAKTSLVHLVPILQQGLWNYLKNQGIGSQPEIEFLSQFSSFRGEQPTDNFDEVRNQIRMSPNSVFLLENTRFHPDEKSKDLAKRTALAQAYATLGSCFVDEAFAVSHRQEATNSTIKDLLPYAYGLAYSREVDELSKLKTNPEHPFIVIMAGSKLETKLPLISKMIHQADTILLGGMLCFTFLKAQQRLSPAINAPELFDSHIEEEFLKEATHLLQSHPDKIILPKDLVYEQEGDKTYARDLGPLTLKTYADLLKKAKTVFWNGTLGYYEKKPYDTGTIELAKSLSQLPDTYVVIGGGDTSSSLPSSLLDSFDFISMGGGATLEFLAS